MRNRVVEADLFCGPAARIPLWPHSGGWQDLCLSLWGPGTVEVLEPGADDR